jgi:hypothetical protein
MGIVIQKLEKSPVSNFSKKCEWYELQGKVHLPFPVTAQSKTWVCGRSLAGIAGSNPTDVMDVFLVSVTFRQIEDSATS